MPQFSRSDLSGKILTVKGPIDPSQLGKTICHEHLFIDFRVVYQDPPDKKDIKKALEKVQLNNLGWIRNFWNSNKDNLLLNNFDDAISELNDFKNYGNSIVEVTTMGSIRIKNHEKLIKSLSENTDVNIIIGSGFYVDNSLPIFFENYDVKKL